MKYFLIILAVVGLVSCTRGKAPAAMSSEKYIIRTEIAANGKTPIHESPITTSQQSGEGQWLTYIDDIDNFSIAYPADYPKEHSIFMSDMSIERPTSP
jgi:hypothetical protein